MVKPLNWGFFAGQPLARCRTVGGTVDGGERDKINYAIFLFRSSPRGHNISRPPGVDFPGYKFFVATALSCTFHFDVTGTNR